MKSIAVTLCCLFALPAIGIALEIKNPSVTTSGSIVTLNYDLLGKPGEKSAQIDVSVVIDGERYKPGMINVTGDYGSNISVGKHKKITWAVLKDMPAGYVGPMSFEMNANPEASNDPFNMLGLKNKTKLSMVSDLTVADPKSKLIWMRSPLAIKPVNSLSSAVSVVGRMNQQKYLGCNDWRLPKKEEYESLLKMLELYGYKSGQSLVPYLSMAGFTISNDSRFWTIDRSSVEVIGRSVSVYGSGQYGGQYGGSTSYKTTSSNYNSGSGRYSRNNSSLAGSGSGSANYYGNATATSESAYDGLDCLFMDTKDGYFYKHNGSTSAYVFAVRGDSSAELYGVSIQTNVSINP